MDPKLLLRLRRMSHHRAVSLGQRTAAQRQPLRAEREIKERKRVKERERARGEIDRERGASHCRGTLPETEIIRRDKKSALSMTLGREESEVTL